MKTCTCAALVLGAALSGCLDDSGGAVGAPAASASEQSLTPEVERPDLDAAMEADATRTLDPATADASSL